MSGVSAATVHELRGQPVSPPPVFLCGEPGRGRACYPASSAFDTHASVKALTGAGASEEIAVAVVNVAQGGRCGARPRAGHSRRPEAEIAAPGSPAWRLLPGRPLVGVKGKTTVEPVLRLLEASGPDVGAGGAPGRVVPAGQQHASSTGTQAVGTRSVQILRHTGHPDFGNPRPGLRTVDVAAGPIPEGRPAEPPQEVERHPRAPYPAAAPGPATRPRKPGSRAAAAVGGRRAFVHVPTTRNPHRRPAPADRPA